MRDLIMDHGSEFGAHIVHTDGTWNGCFKQHLEKHGIRPILGSVAHPQTNGKLERFFREYKRHGLISKGIDVKKKFGVLVEKDEDSYYVASVSTLPGCHTQAKSLDEFQERIIEAIEAYL